MNLPEDFTRTLPEKPPEELCDILANSADYLPEAVEAAGAELQQRGLPQTNVASMMESATAKRAAEEDEYRDGPLEPAIRALILIFGLLPGIGFSIYYYLNGCKKKGRQSLIWILWHFLFALVLGIVSFLIYSIGRLG